MSPRFPFSFPLLVIQLLVGGLGVFGVLNGVYKGWILIAGVLWLTGYLSRIYNESSTNPEHDEIMGKLVSLTQQQQTLAWKNYQNGSCWPEIKSLEKVVNEFNKKIELDHNGLYRWKR